MISKELLSAVLKTEIDNCEINRIWCIYNYVEDEENDKWGYSSINIYELAFRARDYLLEKYGYKLDMSLAIEEIFKNATQFYKVCYNI